MARALHIPEADAARMREQYAALNEAQGRQYLGREARDRGRGGVAAVARAVGVDPRTVARGKREVEAGLAWSPGDRLRAPGAGRPRAESRFAALTGGDLHESVSSLVDASSYGDPCVETVLTHTNATAAKVAAEIERLFGFRISETTCRRVIAECGYTLQRNRKIEQVGKRHPMRDEQFRYREVAIGDFTEKGDPILSGDSKARVNPGNFAAGGSELRRKGDARRAEDHDFPHKWREIYEDGHEMIDEGRMGANAVLTPYGLYDPAENAAHVTIGTSTDACAFAAQALVNWYEARGRHSYPDATEILLLLDGGGSNHSGGYLYKLELARACKAMGLEAITVFHYPPGTSRYNPIERHVWAPISRSWAGKPIGTAEEAQAYIEATTTEKGLDVSCEIDWGVYRTEAAKERERRDAGLPKGPTSEQLFFEIADIEHFHDDPAMMKWNYRIVLK